MLARIGGRSSGATAYLGVAFVIVSSLAGLQAAGLVAANREEEADGHLDNLLVRPVRRVPWLAGRLLVASASVTVTALVAAVAAYLGAATQDSGVGLGSMLGAGLNAVPAGIVILGIGTAAQAFVPRQASAVAYAAVGWSFLVELVGGIVEADHWLLDTSFLHHLAPAPSVAPRWGVAAVLVGLGLLLAVAGAVRFDRRDLSTA
jgi:ABC-2 type transport system permease protein